MFQWKRLRGNNCCLLVNNNTFIISRKYNEEKLKWASLFYISHAELLSCEQRRCPESEQSLMATLMFVCSYAESVGAKHYHTSAKLNKGIEELFLDLCKSKTDSIFNFFFTIQKDQRAANFIFFGGLRNNFYNIFLFKADMIYSLIIKHILLNRLISWQLVQITLVNHINHIPRHFVIDRCSSVQDWLIRCLWSH